MIIYSLSKLFLGIDQHVHIVGCSDMNVDILPVSGSVKGQKVQKQTNKKNHNSMSYYLYTICFHM